MKRRAILLIVYFGTLTLLGALLLIPFISAGTWYRNIFLFLLASIPVCFWLKRDLTVSAELSRGPGDFLWGTGYWGSGKLEDSPLQTMDPRLCSYLIQWFGIFLSSAALHFLLPVSSATAQNGLAVLYGLCFYCFLMPFYGIFYRACFAQFQPESISASCSPKKGAAGKSSIFRRIPGRTWESLILWSGLLTSFWAVMPDCADKPFSLRVSVLFVPIFFILTLISLKMKDD
ncbi:MAG: hypothetical protein IJF17_11630 [Thermoguttaceae bacterium]|nr:hypothetical protein [Thermoguttaceae bacterium]